MYPYLFETWLPNWHLSTYAVALASAFTAAYLTVLYQTIRSGENPKIYEPIFLLCVAGSLIGARLFHVLFEEWAFYKKHPTEILAFEKGGFTFYGGVLVCCVLIGIYTRYRKLGFLKVMDRLTPAVLLGLGIGRLGCLAAGCCWGRICELPWAVTYSHPQTLAGLRFVPVHPVQAYEALGALCLFWVLIRKPQTRTGRLFFQGLFGYGILRFALEFFRADDYRGFILGGALSIAQALSLAAIFSSFLFLWGIPRKKLSTSLP